LNEFIWVFLGNRQLPLVPHRQLEDQKSISEKLQTAALISLMHHRELSDSGFFTTLVSLWWRDCFCQHSLQPLEV